MHDDLQVFRLFEFDKCVKDGQIPCRWVPDAGYGYGYPLMQFYPPMPYYPMEILKILGLGYFWPVKIMFALSFILSGIGMYLLAKEFFGKWGGVISSVLYVYAPYHSVDIYVRGAMNESWGMVWFPFVLLYIYKLITQDKNRWNFILLSIALSFQISSHNVMTMVFAPTAIIWALFWLIKSRKIFVFRELTLSGLLGVGLAAFFFIPVILEQKYVHVDSMMVGYFNYLAHFADIKQLFLSRFWGYGGSTWGPEDGMSFAIGQIQWVAAIVASLFAIVRFKKDKAISIMVCLLVFFGFLYAFLTHGRSADIWKALPLLQYAQFPWRLVALIVFYFSFAAGYVAMLPLNKLTKNFLLSILLVATIIWNIPFFRVERHVRVTLPEKLSGLQWENQVTGGIFDYLPRSAPKPPGGPAFTLPIFKSGYGGILDFQTGSNWLSFTAHVSSSSAEVMVPLYTFPGLYTKVDDKVVPTLADPDLGRVTISLSQGVHRVYSKIGYTPVRAVSDIATIISLLVLIVLIRHARKHP